MKFHRLLHGVVWAFALLIFHPPGWTHRIETTHYTTKLNLQDAILLALKNSPKIIQAINNRKLQRYDLIEAKQQFQPQFSISSSLRYNRYRGSSDYINQSATMTPTVSWATPLGTSMSANYSVNPSKQIGGSNYISRGNSWTLTVTQPLLKGFGTDVNTVALENAKDDQIIDNLNLKNTIMGTISTVIGDYYSVLKSEQSLMISAHSLKRSETVFQKRQLLYEAGRTTKLDVIQARVDINNQTQSLEQAKQNLQTAKATLLKDLGLPNDTYFELQSIPDIVQLEPDMKKALTIAEAQNIDLQLAMIKNRQQDRNMLKTRNDNLWDLNLSLTESMNTTTTNYSQTISSNNESQTRDTNISLNLTIPLDRVSVNKANLQAAINQMNQKITLHEQRRTLVTDLQTSILNLHAQWVKYQNAVVNKQLAEMKYKGAQISYQYGKLDAFNLSQQHQQYIQASTDLVNSKFEYLQQTVKYQTILGTLLADWHINFSSS